MHIYIYIYIYIYHTCLYTPSFACWLLVVGCWITGEESRLRRAIKGRRRPDEVGPVERAPEAPRFHVCALRAHFQQKYGKEKHERDKQGSFPGSFVRSTVQVPGKVRGHRVLL